MHEFEEIDGIKQSINKHAKNCKTVVDELYSYLENNHELIKLLIGEVPEIEKISSSEIEKMDESIKTWIDFSHSISILSDEVTEWKVYLIICGERFQIYQMG